MGNLVANNDNEPIAPDNEFDGLNEFGMTPEEFEYFLKYEVVIK